MLEGNSDGVELLNKLPPKPVDGVLNIFDPKAEVFPVFGCPNRDGACPKGAGEEEDWNSPELEG